MNPRLSLCLLGLAALIAPLKTSAVVAYPFPVDVRQPDGSVLTVIHHGDEHINWITTTDGYSVTRNDDGNFCYSQSDGHTLSASAVTASNPNLRSEAEIQFLKSVPKHLRLSDSPLSAPSRAGEPARLLQPDWNYSDFKGLVILVEYTDRKFSRNDISDIFNDMINRENYRGYTDIKGNAVKCPGSVHDYFRDNSMGRFKPTFDVVGPVTINFSKTYINQTENTQPVMKAACRAADDLVDFSDYDANGDGYVDMVYFVFAGAGSHNPSNNQSLLWPHAFYIYNLTLDGVKLDRYACGTELLDSEESYAIDGIGTMCHEFSHVLGLADEYDTDYEESGGQSTTPGFWSVMDAGSYGNDSKTPSGYTLFQRYQCGFADPQTISSAGNFSIEPLNVSNSGYRIDSPNKNEFFLLENRQLSAWDAELPGHGMLLWRADLSDDTVWDYNTVNTNPDRSYLEIIRATPYSYKGVIYDSDGDTFPGSGSVSEISSITSPAMLTHDLVGSPWAISGISESADGLITFSVIPENQARVKLTEDFETMSTTSADAEGIEGRFCSWSFSQGTTIVSSTIANLLSGQKGVAIHRSGVITTTSPVSGTLKNISFDAYNPSNTVARFRILTSVDNGTSWTPLSADTSDGLVHVDKRQQLLCSFPADIAGPFRVRIVFESGTLPTGMPCYLDNISFSVTLDNSAVEDIIAPSADSFSANVSGNTLCVSSAAGTTVTVYAIDGTTAAIMPVDSAGSATAVLSHGLYVVTDGVHALKVVI